MVEPTVFIATSLDGFIARLNGEIDWLTSPVDPPVEHVAGEAPGDYGFADFMQSVDAIVMGRNTYETVLGFGEFPYGSTPLIVLSSRPITIPPPLEGKVERMNASPEEVVRTLTARKAGRVYVDGGRTVQGFLAAGLIRRMIITRLPILIGDGIPLFGPLPADLRLRHVGTKTFDSGLVQSEYEVV